MVSLEWKWVIITYGVWSSIQIHCQWQCPVYTGTSSVLKSLSFMKLILLHAFCRLYRKRKEKKLIEDLLVKTFHDIEDDNSISWVIKRIINFLLSFIYSDLVDIWTHKWTFTVHISIILSANLSALGKISLYSIRLGFSKHFEIGTGNYWIVVVYVYHRKIKGESGKGNLF